MLETSILFASLITGLTQMVKTTGLVPSTFLPVVAVLIGGLVGYAILGHDIISVAIGLLAGLTTTGMVSVVKGEINKGV